MHTAKIVSSSKKEMSQKPPFQKKVYKSYRELLQLDRPKKNIVEEESESEQDFLEKLLKQEKKKVRRKKKERKPTTQSENKQKTEKVQSPKMSREKEKGQKQEQNKQKKGNQLMDEIEMFLAQTKEIGKEETKNPENEVIVTVKKSASKSNKPKSSASVKPTQSLEKYKELKKKLFLNNPIFLEKTVETPPILYSSAHQNFSTSLGVKNQGGYQHLLSQKIKYQSEFKRQSMEPNRLDQKEHSAFHLIKSKLSDKFTFHPQVQPSNPNWRLMLTLNPLLEKPAHKFIDRQRYFQSEQEQARFVQSLREQSKIRR